MINLGFVLVFITIFIF